MKAQLSSIQATHQLRQSKVYYRTRVARQLFKSGQKSGFTRVFVTCPCFELATWQWHVEHCLHTSFCREWVYLFNTTVVIDIVILFLRQWNSGTCINIQNFVLKLDTGNVALYKNVSKFIMSAKIAPNIRVLENCQLETHLTLIF